MRTMLRTWSRKHGGRWYRIRWYQRDKSNDIRLRLGTPDGGIQNIYTSDLAEAEAIWNKFKEQYENNG
jgi:hypothetical protein